MSQLLHGPDVLPFLEKLLDVYFKLHAQKPKRGKQAKADAYAEQEPLYRRRSTVRLKADATY